jgi:hypothetical protein
MKFIQQVVLKGSGSQSQLLPETKVVQFELATFHTEPNCCSSEALYYGSRGPLFFQIYIVNQYRRNTTTSM